MTRIGFVFLFILSLGIQALAQDGLNDERGCISCREQQAIMFSIEKEVPLSVSPKCTNETFSNGMYKSIKLLAQKVTYNNQIMVHLPSGSNCIYNFRSEIYQSCAAGDYTRRGYFVEFTGPRDTCGPAKLPDYVERRISQHIMEHNNRNENDATINYGLGGGIGFEGSSGIGGGMGGGIFNEGGSMGSSTGGSPDPQVTH